MSEPSTPRDNWVESELAACKRNYIYVAAERDRLTAQRDALLAACQRLKAVRYLGSFGPEEIDRKKRAWDAVETAIALALPRPIESPTCTSMFEPEKGGE